MLSFTSSCEAFALNMLNTRRCRLRRLRFNLQFFHLFFYNYFVILITRLLKRVTTIVPVICPLQEMKKTRF